ncbi:TIGR03862 family flavoprotein [Zemynaea arenosa]|nr:TIGR03862 family flavoprotein [Massilia arenosa]
MTSQTPRHAAIIGAGPAGLMAAEMLAAAGAHVDVYDAMPSAGRKFLLAGKGGMNITHAEDYASFITRYRGRAPQVQLWLDAFTPAQVREWIHGLGIETFVGTSGRVFPTDMKAAPLLRAWLHRLREAGVRFHMRHKWLGWEGDALRMLTPDGEQTISADAVVLALGGASWPRLGSDAAWVPLLEEKGVNCAPLVASNCGFDAAWSEHFSSRHAGEPLTTAAIEWLDPQGKRHKRKGQFVVTQSGVEGSLIYAISADVRDRIAQDGSATIWLDLLPDLTEERVFEEVSHPRGSRSLSTHLHSRLALKGVKAGLLRECLDKATFNDKDKLARAIKRLPLVLHAARPVAEAISSAGGVRFESLDGTMLREIPGLFVAGEMIDWEAPTGGYLLTACFGSGRAAGLQASRYLSEKG